MHKIISFALGGLLLATAVIMAQPGMEENALANKQGGAKTRLQHKMQKRSQKASPDKGAAPAEARLANKQGGAKTRLLHKMQKRSQKAAPESAAPAEAQLA